jgi:hypothetical protein
MRLHYGIHPGLPKPEYSGLYLNVSQRFTVNQEMTGKFSGKGSSAKVILQDTASGGPTPQLYLFKPGGGESVGAAQAHQVRPGVFFVQGRVAYDISLDLPTVGKDIVPLGVAMYNGEIGSLQPFIRNTENLGDLAQGQAVNPALSSGQAKQLFKEIWEENPKFRRFRENLRAYDHVINNPDRNWGNYLVEFNDDMTIKRFYAIDQDLALNPGARSVLWKEREAVPRFATPKQLPNPFQPAAAEQARLGKISKELYDEFLMMKVNESSVREALTEIYGTDRQTLDGIFKRLDEVLRDYNDRLKTMKPGDVFAPD